MEKGLLKDRATSSESPKRIDRTYTDAEHLRNRVEVLLGTDKNNTPFQSSKKSVENPFELGFDKVCNFVFYFPHNNIEELFPREVNENKTAIFDYGVETYAENTKGTLRKFVNILKSKVQMKQQQNTEQKTRRSSIFKSILPKRTTPDQDSPRSRSRSRSGSSIMFSPERIPSNPRPFMRPRGEHEPRMLSPMAAHNRSYIPSFSPTGRASTQIVNRSYMISNSNIPSRAQVNSRNRIGTTILPSYNPSYNYMGSNNKITSIMRLGSNNQIGSQVSNPSLLIGSYGRRGSHFGSSISGLVSYHGESNNTIQSNF